MDPLLSTLLIALFPAVIIMLMWYAFRGERARKEIYFLLGFLAISLFYVFAPDPALVYKLYGQGGDTTPILIFSLISTMFLAIAVFVFKAYRRA